LEQTCPQGPGLEPLYMSTVHNEAILVIFPRSVIM
jgi:hypothetical protein